MKKKLNKLLDILIVVVIVICVFNILNSSFKIFEWKKDGDDIKDQLLEVLNMVKITEITPDSENVEIIEQEEEIPEYNPYWAYINMNMIDVDFYDLKDVNSDVVGWIQVNGTNINYPYVQTDNNEYYLTHAFDKSKNSAGWVFLDYRNSKDLSDKNNIIYAHGRYDKTMFGSLRNALTNGWLNNTNNFIIKISNAKENTMWQVFSVYHIPTTSDYLKINFNTDEGYLEFLNMLKDRSAHDFDTSVSVNDRILTLSTCFNDEERVVIHAKLIMKENKSQE